MVHSFLFKTAALVSSTVLASTLLASLGAANEKEGIVSLKHLDGSSAEVSLLGAQVISFHSIDDVSRNVLFFSDQSRSDGTKLGGVSISFPVVGSLEGDGDVIPMDGFARTSKWTFDSMTQATNRSTPTTAKFSMKSNPDTLRVWPYSFQLTYEVNLWGPMLETKLTVLNTHSTSIRFNALIQDHLTINVVPKNYVSISELNGVEYYDRLTAKTQTDSRLSFLTTSGPVDSVYKNVKKDVRAYFWNPNHELLISASAGIGNGGPDLIPTKVDRVISNVPEGFGHDEYLRMIAIGSGAVMEEQEISSGQQYTLQQMISNRRTSRQTN